MSLDKVDYYRVKDDGLDEVLDEVRRLLADLRHGSVTLIVQDGRVVQIDATRKVRFAGSRGGDRR